MFQFPESSYIYPGMQVPESVMKLLGEEKTKEEQRSVGLKVAHDTLKMARELKQVKGAYIFPPFGKYELVKELLG